MSAVLPDLAAIEACEQRLVNLWPAAETLLFDRWALRFAHGYSGRANSASALWRDADLDMADMGHIADLYRAAGLQPAIRLTPLAVPTLRPRLEAAGWRQRSHSRGMVAAACASWSPAPDVAFSQTPTPGWLAGVSALQEESKRNPAHLEAIVGRIRLPVGFATVMTDGWPVGFGMAALDRGWAEIGAIILAPDVRGRGLGRSLVTSLLAWARDSGARRVFLQVEASNTRAIALYRALGFADLYDYYELRLPL